MKIYSIFLILIGFYSINAKSDTLSTCKEVASQINSTVPIQVDNRTILKNTICFKTGSVVTLTYLYSLDFGGQPVLQSNLNNLRKRILNGWCTNPDQRAAINLMNIEAQYHYPDGRYIGNLTFSKNDC